MRGKDHLNKSWIKRIKTPQNPEPSSKQCCGSEMLIRDPIFAIPDPRSRLNKIPGSASASKSLNIFTQKIVFKLSEI
jgi:hypothetical protein